jgi:glycosyltransferase involved in cell wall biosynthesis
MDPSYKVIMEKLRILMIIVIFYPYTGGAEKQAQKLASELVKRGTDVTVITGRWNNNLKKIEEFNGFKIIRNFTNFDFRKREKINTDKSFFYSGELDKKSKLKSAKIILRKIFVRLSVYIYQASLFFFLISQRKNYDVIHAHQVLYPAFISTLCARILKKPVIAKVGSSGFNSDINQIKRFPEGKMQLRYILKNINRIICTSKIMIEEFVKEGADKDKIVLIRNGVNVVYFNRSYNSCETLVTMGRFIKSKNINFLITAFSKVIKTTAKKLKLILIGDGPEKDNIVNLIKKLGLENNIILTGMVSNPEDFLKESDLFVFPSLIEGLSNSLIEAMSLKLPCMVSNISGNIEVLGENDSGYAIKEGEFKISECGIFFNPSDTGGLINAINYVMNNPEVREKLGESAYRKILTEYNIKEVADRYLELYREVLKI